MSQHLRQEGTSTELKAPSSNAETGLKSTLRLQRAICHEQLFLHQPPVRSAPE